MKKLLQSKLILIVIVAFVLWYGSQMMKNKPLSDRTTYADALTNGDNNGTLSGNGMNVLPRRNFRLFTL